MDLNALGWTPFFAEAFASHRQTGCEAARVAAEHRGGYRVYSARGELAAELSGRFRYKAALPGDFPAVGDWVAVETRPEQSKAVIQAVLPRRTKFSRSAAGNRAEEQIVAANIDDVFLVTSLNRDLNPRRLERYLTLAWESGADPVIVLTKADLCEDVAAEVRRVESVSGGVPAYVVSAVTGEGLAELAGCLRPGRTAVLLGSSGVGKSTLINFWCGEERLKVQAIREDDDRGRHTTSHRQLVLLPAGGLLLDTPGMRELQLWEGASGLHETFADVELFAARCHFADCQHDTEPDCAVRGAVALGELDAARLESHRKLVAEMRYLERKQDPLVQAAERRRIKSIAKNMRARYRIKESATSSKAGS
jgi:ribosome biogenesis GTPase